LVFGFMLYVLFCSEITYHMYYMLSGTLNRANSAVHVGVCNFASVTVYN